MAMKRLAILACLAALLAGVPSGLADDAPAPQGKDEVGKIAGTPVARDNGTWLGIELKDNNFVMTFYNAKKKPMAADATSAVFWWPVNYQPLPERTQLTPAGEPSVFSSPRAIKPPHSFKLHITLLDQARPDYAESFVVDFSG